MGDLFDAASEHERHQLQAAGWTPFDYAGLSMWRAPSGDVCSQAEAIKRLHWQETEEKRSRGK